MTIPEAVLKQLIDHFFDWTVDNHLTSKKEESYLWFLFGDKKLGKYDYYKNAVAIFSKDDDHPRKIETHLFFNRERFSLPTIHIGLPGEQLSNANGVGYDFTFKDQRVFNDPLKYIDSRSRHFHSRFNIVCTSDNTFEVLIIYNWLKAAIIGNVDLFEMNGLQNTIISGNDIILDESIAPNFIYSRALAVDVMYETIAPSFQTYRGVTNIFTKGIDP